MSETTVTLHGATRRGSSSNGNPRWTLHTSAGDLLTQADSAIGNEVDNHTAGEIHSWIGRKVVLTLTRAGRVSEWRLA